MKYIAKKDCWFKEGTEATPLEYMYTSTDGVESWVFQGTYIVGSCNPDGYDLLWYNQGFKNGDEVMMTEVCGMDEFDII